MGGRLAVGAIAEDGGWRAAIRRLGAASRHCSIAFALILRRSGQRRLDQELSDPACDPYAFAGSRPALSVRAGLSADGRVRHNLQLYRLSARCAAVLAQSGDHRLHFRDLSRRRGRIASRRRACRTLWAAQGVIGFAIAFVPLGVAATLPDNLPLIILGVGLVTAGSSAAHSIASSWIGLRAEKARRRRARCIFSSTTSARTSRDPSAAGLSRVTVGRASPPSSARWRG